MSFDNICKYLSEQYPERFAAWLLGQPSGSVDVLKTELSVEPIRADFVAFLSPQEQILHLEFQVEAVTVPPMPLRMLDYYVRLRRQYGYPVEQVVIFLKPTTNAAAYVEQFTDSNTVHRYRVIRLWEQDPSPLLQDAALLPLASLAASAEPVELLNRVALEVGKIEEVATRREIANCAQILAGLRFDESLIRQVFREGIMRESVIYQAIVREGVEQGQMEGELAMVLRQLPRRIGPVAPELQLQIQALSQAQVEELGEALLDFSEAADLVAWLQADPRPRELESAGESD